MESDLKMNEMEILNCKSSNLIVTRDLNASHLTAYFGP